MKIKSLTLKNFRNHKDLSLLFNKRLIFFIGENGEGKTNILESLNMFATLKSFRNNSDEEISGWEDNYYFLQTEVEKNLNSFRAEIGFSKKIDKKKKVKLNGEELKKKSEFIGEVKCVVFSPVDLQILDGGPSERRKFIDIFLSYTNKNYIEYLLEYNKILKQRNTLLKTGRTSDQELNPWDKLIAERGQEIINLRDECILKLNDLFIENLNELSGEKDNFHIIYKPNVKENYLQTLKEARTSDIRFGYSTKGIHRDDIFIGKEGMDITSFGSQGQKRSSVISLRTAQFQYVKNEINESPILLIDDVIRELDVKRREYFVNLLMNCGQAFFTTTDLEGINDYIGTLSESIQVFEVKRGEVREINI